MNSEATFGIYGHEVEPILAMVRNHASLVSIVDARCPACGAKMAVAFNKDGTGFQVACEGDPLHASVFQDIDDPPAWWEECYQPPREVSWYVRKEHSYDNEGTLHLKMGGRQVAGNLWWGTRNLPREHADYDLWHWILHDSGCMKDNISMADLEELRRQYRGDSGAGR